MLVTIKTVQMRLLGNIKVGKYNGKMDQEIYGKWTRKYMVK